MKIVSQEICTSSTSMTIKDPKEGTFRPFFSLSGMRFEDIQNDAYSIFIVISNNSFISVCSICSNNAILLVWTFWSINSSVKDLIWWYKRRELFILIGIINRIIDQVLLDWGFILNNRSNFWIRRNFACLKMFHNLSDHFLLFNCVLTHWFLRSNDALPGWFSRSWNIYLIVLWVRRFSEQSIIIIDWWMFMLHSNFIIIIFMFIKHSFVLW